MAVGRLSELVLSFFSSIFDYHVIPLPTLLGHFISSIGDVSKLWITARHPMECAVDVCKVWLMSWILNSNVSGNCFHERYCHGVIFTSFDCSTYVLTKLIFPHFLRESSLYTVETTITLTAISTIHQSVWKWRFHKVLIKWKFTLNIFTSLNAAKK